MIHFSTKAHVLPVPWMTTPTRTLTYGDRSVFIETVAPQPLMLIFGAGHIAQPLSVMAQVLGFRVIVADARVVALLSEMATSVSATASGA